MELKNTPYKVTDTKTNNEKVIWDSRSVAVSLSVFAHSCNGEWYVLAVKRGKGCHDYQGYWCLPCGYLDWNETEYHAAIRETYEETGIDVFENEILKYNCSANPKLNRQNVCFQLYTVLPKNVNRYLRQITTRYSEKDEVEKIEFINIESIDHYTWAFGHKNYIKSIFDTRINISWCKRKLLKLYNKYLFKDPNR